MTAIVSTPDSAKKQIPDAMKRIVVVSTPRSGNTWLRLMLSRLYNLTQLAEHFPESIPWDKLRQDCIVQIHWHPDEAFLNLLHTGGFVPVTIARHPLDVLLSILQFAPKEPQTANWLRGEGGSEKDIIDARPNSREFRRYVVSDRASSLLSVSSEWWKRSDTLKIKYEDLIANPRVTLSTIFSKFGNAGNSLENTLNALTVEKLRTTTSNGHFWQGKAGLWKKLFPVDMVAEAYSFHREVFDTLGYTCDAGEVEDEPVDIDQMWHDMRLS